ncbi:MAG: DNA mismatch repair endonuclease MutL [Candidatus Eremiobacteraeota bacterium]|nr:DNA mismatch repair endonuclease MutL [Candidatus Eremiobacteraeota bacterium]MBV9700281.1 DNA mismatch repair endonuclease MutL [Candidatus Eremiobacteraeota bacterium]
MAIRELDALTIGQIAAGEIIERPASVVKELVENSIDAHAARITVNLRDGGVSLIEVSDDGTGMAPEDLPLAVRRHATSKLMTASQLESIGTLGFRGEGLASIAAVAETEIVSRTAEAATGASITAQGESIGSVQPVAAPAGTKVCVRELFERLPVRREYLRSSSAEFNRVSSWLSAFALGYPRVAFALRHDGKDVWTMPPTDSALERLAMVFGRDAAERLLSLDGAAGALQGRVRGYVSAPGYDRPDRRMQLLFVNGRLLRSALLAGAWTAGYATFAMLGRHPYGVLFLDLPPEHVDQNVHPTKSDVRLRYATQVFEATRGAIATTLNADARERFAQQTGAAQSALSFAPATEKSAPRVLAQIDKTFILASDGEGLLLVDQHAAHERIAYETIAGRARDSVASQALLVPQVVELDAARSVALDRVLDTLQAAGLDIDSFGERTYRISATPAGYNARPFDLAKLLDDLTVEPKQREVRERVWATLACHSVTRAGEPLAFEEMTALLERLQRCQNPMHCPHGRPTMITIASEEIGRMFKRV